MIKIVVSSLHNMRKADCRSKLYYTVKMDRLLGPRAWVCFLSVSAGRVPVYVSMIVDILAGCNKPLVHSWR